MNKPSVEARVAALLQPAAIPGLSMAVVRDGKVEAVHSFGVRDGPDGKAVDTGTVFDAASLSKPVFACAVLQLAQAGMLDLDEPLSRLVACVAPDDPAAARITARHVLSHTTGLPNWRSKAHPLRTYFPPGSRFSYSGEAFAYLQLAVENVLQQPLERLMQERVFEPLGMASSSYVWQPHFEQNFASPHEAGAGVDKVRPLAANAAWTLQTTAADYARFLAAVIAGQAFEPGASHRWLEAQAQVPRGNAQSLDSEPAVTDPQVAWGLGWGLEPAQGTFFHWGANHGARAFAMGCPQDRSAVVSFMNASNGLDILPGLLEATMPGEHPAVRWLLRDD